MKKTWLKIITIFLILSAVGVGLLLVNKNLPSHDVLIVEAVLGQDQPMISKLGPEPRVKIENGYQAVFETPIYFDLRSLPWFRQAQVYLVFQEDGLELEGIGGQVGSGWQYEVKKPIVVTKLDGGWKKAVFEFDLNNIYQQKNIRRFLISAKQNEDSGELRIKLLKIVLNR